MSSLFSIVNKIRPWQRIKRFAPKSLFGRALLILVMPLLLAQLVLGYIFLDRHLDNLLTLHANDIAGEIQFVVALMDEQPAEKLPLLAQEYMHLKIELMKGQKLENQGRRKTGWLYDFMGDALDQHLKVPYYLTLDRNYVHVLAQVPQGVVKVSTSRKRLFNRTTPLVLVWSALSAFLLFGVASLFMRNQIKPLWRLADAAERFGKGQDVGRLRQEGATEVRQATHAFNTMRDRIQRQMIERTELLAGVSHDLRTPLTRMRLQLAMMPQGEDVVELNRDVAAMQQMIEGFLAFARGVEDEPMRSVNMNALIKDVIQGLSHHKLTIHFKCSEKINWHLKEGFIKRCLTNLLLNSSRYASQVWLTIVSQSHALEIRVDDDGPGIPESERENVFRMFHRLDDEGAGPESGHVGLGLSIARDAVHRHGGQIRLMDAPQGGLRVLIRLPK